MNYFIAAGIALVPLTVLFTTVYWIPKSVLNYLPEDVITKIPTSSNNEQSFDTVALTFDDLPYGNHREIIELLDKYDMKATFFIISSKITEEDKEIFVKAVRNGHQLGNHGSTNSMHLLKNRKALSTEIEDCDKVIKEIYLLADIELPTVMVYRPGCGLFCNETIEVAKELRYQLALGSVYCHDAQMPISTINYWYLLKHIENNDVIILHDRKWTLVLLTKLLPWLQENNYRSVTLDYSSYLDKTE